MLRENTMENGGKIEPVGNFQDELGNARFFPQMALINDAFAHNHPSADVMLNSKMSPYFSA